MILLQLISSSVSLATKSYHVTLSEMDNHSLNNSVIGYFWIHEAMLSSVRPLLLSCGKMIHCRKPRWFDGWR